MSISKHTFSVYLFSKDSTYSSHIERTITQSFPHAKLHLHSGDFTFCNHANAISLIDVQSTALPQHISRQNDCRCLALRVPDIHSLEWYKLGCWGQLDDSVEQLIDAMSAISEGEMWFSRQVLATAVSHYQNGVGSEKEKSEYYAVAYGLTDSEQQVCKMMLEGLSNPQIALYTELDLEAINQRAQSIYTKLNIQSRYQLMSISKSN